MCHGGLDPRYQMRDIDARTEYLSFEQHRKKQAAPVARGGLIARLRDAVIGLLRKDRVHV